MINKCVKPHVFVPPQKMESTMETADKIGLLTGFGWMAGHSWFTTLMLCWLLTPVGMIVVARLLESRKLPLKKHEQYQSFFPGDVYLGFTVTGLLVLAQRLPDREAWYNSTLIHLIILGLTSIVAIGLSLMEISQEAYGGRAMYSPTKLYHNGVLYVGYGYIAVSTSVSVIGGFGWSNIQLYDMVMFVALLGMSGMWAKALYDDNTAPKKLNDERKANAHVSTWKPIWSKT